MDAPLNPIGGADKSRVICILWHAPGTTVDPELERGLKRWQGLVVTGCRSAPAAIAEVMSIERAMRAGKREPTVLLLVEPEKLLGATDVLHTMDKYSPTTRCWCYEPGSSELLRAVTPRDIANWTRVAMERQRAKHPESTPQVHVVSNVTANRPKASSRLSDPVTPNFVPPPQTEIILAQTVLEEMPPEPEARPTSIPSYIDPDDPKLHFEDEPERPPVVPQWEKKAGNWESDNKGKSNPKWGGGVSNVLSADEMAMLLAEDDGRAHT